MPTALLLLALGVVEDVTGVLLVVGLLTSFTGLVLLAFKGKRK